jgi:hypothetical protein
MKSKPKLKVELKTPAQIDAERFYKMRLEHDIFLTTLNNIGERFPQELSEFINTKWELLFPNKEFPQKGETLQKLKVVLQYQIVLNAHRKNGIKPTGKFMESYNNAMLYLDTDTICKSLDRIERDNELAKTIIYPINRGEKTMSKKKKAKTKAKTETTQAQEKKNTTVVKKEKKAAVAKSDTAPAVKKEKKTTTMKKEKQPTVADIMCNLILENKFTDKVILEKSQKAFPDKKPVLGWVKHYRNLINTGKRKDVKKPSKTLSEIVEK